MGQYSEVEVIAEFSEDADKFVDNLEDKVKEYIKSQGTEVFDFDIKDIDVNAGSVDILLASDRAQNTRWRAEKVLEYFKANHLEALESYQAEEMIPETIIHWNKEDE